ncbi:DsbA family protein [Gulosibacter macacae]|uniref:DsbA family protein n=1 Tax=Gulosibacter macacae TaxID=2488791 RepID=A0A3P3W0M6_9MICO|nr:thioredoxin domain-containing protein [Gulosibacter macacae]RRJ88334.1 DsbA family protein [Gulosibacter macacae]
MATKDRDQIRKLREEANALRKQEEAKKRRARMLTQIGVIAAAVLVIAAVVVVAVMAPTWFGNRNVPASQGTVAVATSTGGTAEVPIAVSEEGVLIGDPNAAVKIDYYLDFSCSYCKDYHDAMGHEYETLVGDGEAAVNFHFIRYVNDFGTRAGASLIAAIQHQPELFFTIMDGIYATPAQDQVNWNFNNYTTLLSSLGVTNSDAISSITNGDYAWYISDSTQKARSAGVPGTPSLYFNGERNDSLPTDGASLRTLVAELSGAPAETPAETPAAETPAAETPAETPAAN